MENEPNTICNSLELVVNNRRDPNLLRRYYEEVRSTFPWLSRNQALDKAKEMYAKLNQ